ncbi:MAG TPA: DUF378 domain-containing protein [Candidatus Omnitrophica bacterium]|nr:MAG: hypothetical protein A2105_02795 [Omnitrophica WOR_2 bacterium GWF2_63_9]OGX36445.1 MAG: hypothetical protein A3B73_01030 [Omnitrophica WOR_2 bacterium RIFCSPHIGHO2_02_FULL_63_39]OGX44046.1 MAG: hypothetical protein A3I71_00610 [Omnitrophica WOR_2 bacterium RIFCSPLOWO2_02_FULL_63_16]OGX48082.1 MAG: hypothetical protein A3G88_01970 [Omnitrophica WOR_2 bacterium RIFCSPLOWO2_12_FULL_63_16]HAM39756.1 DUF378 domain-containing protein [Candidatus Omnitrophota bacterium]
MTGGKSCVVCKIVGLLVGLGALNWGLYGLFQTDLVASVFGLMTPGAKVVYAIVGLAGILKLVSLCKCCPCQKGSCETK